MIFTLIPTTAIAVLEEPTDEPTITGLDPARGPFYGGTAVVISGTRLAAAEAVTFGNTAADSYVVDSPTQITAISPAQARDPEGFVESGSVYVRVTTAEGRSAPTKASRFYYHFDVESPVQPPSDPVQPPQSDPVVAGVEPNTGPAEGATSVSISGAGFSEVATVQFGTATASFRVENAGLITARSPSHEPGAVHVTVTSSTDATSPESPADIFTYGTSAEDTTPAAGPPIVGAVSPARGKDYGGENVEIHGANLRTATAVKFGDHEAPTFRVQEPYGYLQGTPTEPTLIVQTPAHSVGTVAITVTTPAGTSAPTEAGDFTYYRDPPSVSSISPVTGPAAGGTKVTLTGDFLDTSTSVSFGSRPAMFLRVESPTRLIAVSPPQPLGTVSAVTVTSPTGSSAPGSASTFRYQDGQWVPTGSMDVPHRGHSLTVLDGPRCRADSSRSYCGDVLAVGNIGGNVGAGATAELFDQTDGVWRPTGAPTGTGTSTLLDGPECHGDSKLTYCGKVLMVRSDGTTSLYDPEAIGQLAGNDVAGGWTSAATLINTGRVGHTATVLADGRVLVIGGSTPAAEVFVPPSPSSPIGGWTHVADMLMARSRHASTILTDGRVLSVGGTAGASLTAELYDPFDRTSRLTAPTPSQYSSGHTVTSLADGTALVRAGSSSYVFDPAGTGPGGTVGTWRETRPVNVSRSSHIATRLPDGKVLVAGGTAQETSRTAELYDPQLGRWETTGSMMNARLDPTAVGLPDGRVLVSGGAFGTNTAELYVPVFRPPLGVTNVDPRAGPTTTETSTTITGSGLFPATEVHFGSLPASIVFNAEDELVVIAPPQAQGEVPVTVSTQDGSSTQVGGSRFTYGSGTWHPTAPLAACPSRQSCERYVHTATLLDGPTCRSASAPSYCGDVIVAGGTPDFFGESLRSVQLYDPKSKIWQPLAPMTERRIEHSATLLDGPKCRVIASASYCGRLLVAGGKEFGIGVVSESAELYNPTEDSWSAAGTMTDLRAGHTATLLDGQECHVSTPPAYCGKVLVVGGTTSENGRPPTATADLYDPGTNTWARTGDLGVARHSHTATLLTSGKVLVIGGFGQGEEHFGNVPLDSVELYDPVRGTWQQVVDPDGAPTRMQIPRAVHSATLLEDGACTACGKVLVAGGAVGETTSGGSMPIFTTSSELFDLETGQWEPTGNLNRSHAGPGVVKLQDGRVLATGAGFTFPDEVGPSTAAAEVYDPETGSWEYTGFMSKARGVHTATVINGSNCQTWCGQVLVVGGASSGTGFPGDTVPLDSAEIYVVAPSVSAVEPVSGPSSGGTSIAVHGDGFVDISSVRIDGVPAASFTIDSPTRITAVTPPHARGPAQVTVENSGGTSGRLRPLAGALFNYGVSGPPGSVIGFAATAISESDVELAWGAASSDIGVPPPADEYIVKQANAPITADNFDAATTLCGGTCWFRATELGQRLTLAVADLGPGTTYHFAVRAVDDDRDLVGPISESVSVTTLGAAPSKLATCAPSSVAGGQVLIKGGSYRLLGFSAGTVVGAQSPLYGWFDAGARGAYEVIDSSSPVLAGRGYWAWSRCDLVVTLKESGPASATMPLGGYHASMVGNPSAHTPSVLSGHDFAARWNPATSTYELSGYREPQTLAVGEGAWVFSYRDTTIKLGAS